MEKVNAHIIISGVVQGVGFRYFTSRLAGQYGLAGWVRNTPDGSVEIEVEGDRGLVAAFLDELRIGPSSGHVTAVNVEWRDYTGQLTDFSLRF